MQDHFENVPDEGVATPASLVGRWLIVNLGIMVILFGLMIPLSSSLGGGGDYLSGPPIYWMMIVVLQTLANGVIGLGGAIWLLIARPPSARLRRVVFAAIITLLCLPVLGFGLCWGGAVTLG